MSAIYRLTRRKISPNLSAGPSLKLINFTTVLIEYVYEVCSKSTRISLLKIQKMKIIIV